LGARKPQGLEMVVKNRSKSSL